MPFPTLINPSGFSRDGSSRCRSWRETRHRIARRTGQLAGALLLLWPAAVATAGSAHAVASLNPAPPSWYTCRPAGTGTVCHGKMSFEHFAGFDGTCPQGFDLLENGHSDETGARYYDDNGNLIRRVLHDVYPVNDPLNVLYNSVTGTSVPYRTDATESDAFAVPGDFASVTATFTGNLYSITLPGHGLLVHDDGLLAFAPDGDVFDNHGPKMLFNGEIQKLCAALS
jgi:hypothetical protein